MFAVREGMKQINGEIVDTFERNVDFGGVHMEVEAGTTGFGNVPDEDARGYIRIKSNRGDFFSKITTDDMDRPRQVEITVSGEMELRALLKAVQFATQALADMCDDNID